MAEPETNGVLPASAREMFSQRVWPTLAGCAGCHATQPSIDFLAPGTAEGAYQTLFDFQPPVLDVGAPSASLLITMGKHTGPALGAQGANTIIEWLTAERDERFGDAGAGGESSYELRVGPFMPQHGTPIQLDAGINGASLTVVTEPSEAGLYFKRITLAAGTGIKLQHPLFVSRPAHPIVDEIDRFSEVDVKLAAGATLELGPAWFLSFTASEYLSIHFKTLEAP